MEVCFRRFTHLAPPEKQVESLAHQPQEDDRYVWHVVPGQYAAAAHEIRASSAARLAGDIAGEYARIAYLAHAAGGARVPDCGAGPRGLPRCWQFL